MCVGEREEEGGGGGGEGGSVSIGERERAPHHTCVTVISMDTLSSCSSTGDCNKVRNIKEPPTAPLAPKFLPDPTTSFLDCS